MFANIASSATYQPTLHRCHSRGTKVSIVARSVQAAQQGSQPSTGLPQQAPSRRTALLSLGAAGVLWTLPARADSAVSPGAPAPAEESAPAPVVAPAAGTRTYNERDFILEVPRSFKEVRSDDNGPAGFGAGGKPKSTYERIAAITPLRVKFQSEDGQEQITVIQRNASEIKQSLLQITDLSQLGDLSEVALLLLPREVTVEAQGSAVLERPARETGSPLGTVQPPPQTVYRYTFRTRGQHAHLSIVAKSGKLYLTAGSAPDSRWPEASQRLKDAVVSFRLA